MSSNNDSTYRTDNATVTIFQSIDIRPAKDIEFKKEPIQSWIYDKESTASEPKLSSANAASI